MEHLAHPYLAFESAKDWDEKKFDGDLKNMRLSIS